MLTIHLLGEFSVTNAGQPVTTFNADRPQALLAYLLLHRRAPQARRHVAFVLWPDSSEKQAQSNLRNLLHTLRSGLPESERFLASDNLTLQWRADAPCLLDVAQFEDALRVASTATEDAAGQALIAAVEAYGGDLLPGNYDDWIAPLREALRSHYQDALRRLIQLLEAAGDYRTALRYGGRLLSHDPLDENSYVQVMRLHAFSGDRAGVRRVYEQCVASLARELEVEPSETTRTAYAQLLRIEPSVPPMTALPKAPSAPMVSSTPAPQAVTPVLKPRPLPAVATPFVGREAELRQVTKLLADPACRLLTLIGPGGVGKTRLVLQAAATAQFADGVAFVSLVGVRDIEQSLTMIAHALNVPLAGALPTQEQLDRWLHDKALLLILDNLEQLLNGVEFVSELLAHAPQVKVLATSRERLNLQEEWALKVEGLLATPSTGDAAAPDESPAIALFLQRARRVRNNFDPTPADLALIERICRLVDGMPLGIELAAAWVHLLSCAEIATEIERSLDFLATPARNVPERHRTMRAVFDHSWALLTPDEQQALRRLSVFRGGFGRALAAPVAGATLLQLASLVDKSLLHRSQEDAPTSSGRFELHERVRQYAYRKLHDADEADTVRDRHLQVMVTLAATAEGKLFGATQAAALAELHAEQSNLHTALEWGLRPAENLADASAHAAALTRQLAAMQLVGASARFWYLSGYLQEGRTWLETALALAEQWTAQAARVSVIAPVRAKLLFGAGEIVSAMDRRQQGIALLEESLELYRTLDDPQQLILTLQKLGEVAMYIWPHDAVAACLTESLALARRLADPWLIARSLSGLASLALNQGDYAQSTTLAAESLAIYRRLEPSGSVIVLLNLLGQLALFQGDAAAAINHLEEALALIRQRPLIGNESTAWTLRNLGTALRLAGNLDQATACYRQSLQLRQSMNQVVGAAWAMEGLAAVAVDQGEWVRGTRLWAAADAIRTAMNAPMSNPDRTAYETSLTCLQTALPASAFAAAWQAGAALTVEAAFAEALA